MPRHIASLLPAPQYALDARLGMQYLQQLISRAGADGLPKGIPDEAERSEDWLTNYIRNYGNAHYYINTDGTVVHSLDQDAVSRVKEGAIAVVPVRGIIVKDADLFEEAYWGLTSTTRLARLFRDLRDDDRVVAAVQEVMSPGGQVWGTEAYGKAATAFDAVKPLITHVDHLSASAAYWGSSPSRQILLDGHTSEVGSIGVMMAWLDLIPYFEKEGFVFREFYAPESSKKNEAHRELREKNSGKLIEESMSPTAQLFQEHVKAGRGERLNTKDKAVLQGRVYQGQDAIDAGLADGFATLEEAIALARTMAPIPEEQPQKSTTMSVTKKLVALATALFSDKVEVSNEEITEANAMLAKEGTTNVALVSTAEQKRLNDAATAIATAEGNVTAANAKAAQEVNAAKESATKAAEATKTAEAAAATAKNALDAQNSVIEAAAKKAGIEAKEGTTLLEQLTAQLEAKTAQVETLTTENAKLKEEPASDGKPASVVDEKGDVATHGKDEVLSPEEEAFRKAELK